MATVSPMETSKKPESPPKRTKTNPEADEAETGVSLKEAIASLWNDINSNEEMEAAVVGTIKILHSEVDDLIKAGLQAFHQCEKTESELKNAHDELIQKDAEIQRLRTTEEKNKTSIANLLAALEHSRSQSRDVSRGAMVEAELRAELNVMTTKRDEALTEANVIGRKFAVIQEDLTAQKLKTTKLAQEKLKIEREYANCQRATMSLAKSVDSRSAVDIEFYKRKVADLNAKVSNLTVTVAEKTRQVEDLRRRQSTRMHQLSTAGQSSSRKRSSY